MGLFVMQLALVLALICGIGFWFRRFFSVLIYQHLSPQTFQLVIHYFGLMMSVGLLFVLANVLAQLLNAHQRYFWAESRNLIMSALVVIFIVWRPSILGHSSLYLGYSFGILIAAVILGWVCIQQGYIQFSLHLNRADWQDTWAFWHRVISLLGIGICYTLPFAISQRVLTGFGPQIISAYDYSLRLFAFISVLIVPVILNPYYVKVSHQARDRQFAFRLSLKIILIFALMSAIGFLALLTIGKPLLKLVLVHGAFTLTAFHLSYGFLVAQMGLLFIQSISIMADYVLLSFGHIKAHVVSGIALS